MYASPFSSPTTVCAKHRCLIDSTKPVYCRCNTFSLNPLTPNDHYSGRTAPLTSKRCILYIYSTNIGTEYFKHGIYSSFFFFFFQFVS
jgi:hypothetical protein